MNIVIENNNANIINELRIDSVKRLKGLYDITDIFKEISALQYQKVILDITSLKNYSNVDVMKSLISFIRSNNLILVVSNNDINKDYLKTLINLGIYNFAYTALHIASLYKRPNTYDDAFLLIDDRKNKAKIIGVKNVTKHAGATTLIYILKKHLQKKHKVVALEIDKMDFNFFYSKDMISILENNLEFNLEKYYNSDVILIDVNESEKAMETCDDILYLIEPSTIKINQLMMVNPTVFSKINTKKVILNKCLLDNHDIKQFQSESHLKAFYILPPISERKKTDDYITGLLQKLHL